MGTTTTGAFMAAVLASILLSALAVTNAQAQAVDAVLLANNGQAPSGVNTPGPDQALGGPGAASTAPSSARNWHVDGTLYLWLPGSHGDLNALGYNVGFKASAGDLLSDFRFGIMGLAGMRYKRLVLTSDLLYMALSGVKTRTLPLPSEPQLSTDLLTRTVIFTQKVGFRLVQNEKINIDGMAGFRFWHLGETLKVTPPPPGNNSLYASVNWVDPLVGARIQVPLSPELVVMIGGDVGGWGAGSQLDYQIAGELSYKIKPKIDLGAGWRYLYLDYAQNRFSTQLALSGPVLTLTYTFRRPD